MQHDIFEVALIDDFTEIVATYMLNKDQDIELLSIKDSQAFPNLAPQEVSMSSRSEIEKLFNFLGKMLDEADRIDPRVDQECQGKVVGPEGLTEAEILKMFTDKEAA